MTAELPVTDWKGIIAMKINNIAYLIKEGIRGIFLHGFRSFAAVFATVVCLLIVGTFAALSYNMEIMVRELNLTNEVLVYIDENLSDAEARSVGTNINAVANVYNAVYVSRQEAFDSFVDSQHGDDALSGVDASVLRHRYKVTLVDNGKIKETVDQLQQIDGVVNISAAVDLAEKFSSLQNVLHLASGVIVAVLLVVTLMVIANTVKMAMMDRQVEIAIMRMVGATNGFIRLPYIVEGFILGMFGAGLAFCLEWVGYDMMLKWLDEYNLGAVFTFVPFQELLVPMVATFAAAGFVVGVVGSWTSIRRFLRV